jgi:hypothetical protein
MGVHTHSIDICKVYQYERDDIINAETGLNRVE